MGFAGQWIYPVLASVVAGDIFASEDRNGTWRLLHCRSYGRTALFTAKAIVGIAFPLVAATTLVASSLLAGLLLVGRDPILNLSGSLVGAAHGSRLVAWSLLSQLPVVLAMASIALLLSVVTRNSLVGVGGPVALALVFQLVALVDQPPLLRQLLPSGSFTAWHGLWLDQPFARPVVVGTVSNVAVSLACVVTAGVVFGRRDVSLR